MSASDRPHCRKPEACVAKGEGHCAGCSGAWVLARNRLDPERAAEIQRKASEASAAKAAERRAARLREGPRTIGRSESRDDYVGRPLRSWRPMLLSIAADHGMDLKSILSRSRHTCLVRVRQEMWFRLSRELGASLSEIGRRFGRDHTTVLYGIRRHDARLADREAARPSDPPLPTVRKRPLGPAPAIGTSQRAAWTRKVNATSTEARPC